MRVYWGFQQTFSFRFMLPSMVKRTGGKHSPKTFFALIPSDVLSVGLLGQLIKPKCFLVNLVDSLYEPHLFSCVAHHHWRFCVSPPSRPPSPLALARVVALLLGQDWWRRAREVEREANSTRGLVRAQALVRGYISRSKHAARFSSDNNSISASRGNHL